MIVLDRLAIATQHRIKIFSEVLVSHLVRCYLAYFQRNYLDFSSASGLTAEQGQPCIFNCALKEVRDIWHKIALTRAHYIFLKIHILRFSAQVGCSIILVNLAKHNIPLPPPPSPLNSQSLCLKTLD